MDSVTEGALARENERVWGEYFAREHVSFFQKLLMIHRRVFISRSVRYWFDRVFPRDGVFVEAGAGTSESSGRIVPHDRTLIAGDVCYYVLRRHNVLPQKTQLNIMRLPLADSSVDGIWNLGVMEHFTDDQIHQILCEFRRVLKPGGAILLLWPPWFAPYEIVLNSISWALKTFFGKHVQFFPDEINRYSTRSRLRAMLERAGFRLESAAFSWRDIYSYINVVARPATAES